MTKNELKIRKQIIEACLLMEKKALNQGKAGNISVRWKDGMLITPSGISYQGMKAKKKLGRMGFGTGKKKKGKCNDCGQEGHWAGDAACPEVQAGRRPPFKPKPKAGAKKKSFPPKGGGGYPSKDKDKKKGKKGQKGRSSGAYVVGTDSSTEESDNSPAKILDGEWVALPEPTHAPMALDTKSIKRKDPVPSSPPQRGEASSSSGGRRSRTRGGSTSGTTARCRERTRRSACSGTASSRCRAGVAAGTTDHPRSAARPTTRLTGATTCSRRGMASPATRCPTARV